MKGLPGPSMTVTGYEFVLLLRWSRALRDCWQDLVQRGEGVGQGRGEEGGGDGRGRLSRARATMVSRRNDGAAAEREDKNAGNRMARRDLRRRPEQGHARSIGYLRTNRWTFSDHIICIAHTVPRLLTRFRQKSAKIRGHDARLRADDLLLSILHCLKQAALTLPDGNDHEFLGQGAR